MHSRRGGRAAEGNGLLNRHSSNKGYRGVRTMPTGIETASKASPPRLVGVSEANQSLSVQEKVICAIARVH